MEPILHLKCTRRFILRTQLDIIVSDIDLPEKDLAKHFLYILAEKPLQLLGGLSLTDLFPEQEGISLTQKMEAMREKGNTAMGEEIQ